MSSVRARRVVLASVVLLVALALGLIALARSHRAIDVLNALSGGRPQAAEADIAYGPLPRHRYDLYRAESADAPVAIFFHGGGWDSGSKDRFAFVGRGLAALGITAALPNYRLGPEPPFPAFMEDAALALDAIRRDVAEGRRVVVIGHSAGAHIAALLALDEHYLEAAGTTPCEAIAGWIGLAGPYDFLPLNEDRYRAIFPEATRSESQPVSFAAGPAPDALLLHGTTDETVHAEDSVILADRLGAEGNTARLMLLEGIDHRAIIAALGRGLGWMAPVREPIAAFAREAWERSASTACRASETVSASGS